MTMIIEIIELKAPLINRLGASNTKGDTLWQQSP
jgi:hypothetical protein